MISPFQYLLFKFVKSPQSHSKYLYLLYYFTDVLSKLISTALTWKLSNHVKTQKGPRWKMMNKLCDKTHHVMRYHSAPSDPGWNVVELDRENYLGTTASNIEANLTGIMIEFRTKMFQSSQFCHDLYCVVINLFWRCLVGGVDPMIFLVITNLEQSAEMSILLIKKECSFVYRKSKQLKLFTLREQLLNDASHASHACSMCMLWGLKSSTKDLRVV